MSSTSQNKKSEKFKDLSQRKARVIAQTLSIDDYEFPSTTKKQIVGNVNRSKKNSSLPKAISKTEEELKQREFNLNCTYKPHFGDCSFPDRQKLRKSCPTSPNDKKLFERSSALMPNKAKRSSVPPSNKPRKESCMTPPSPKIIFPNIEELSKMSTSQQKHFLKQNMFKVHPAILRAKGCSKKKEFNEPPKSPILNEPPKLPNLNEPIISEDKPKNLYKMNMERLRQKQKERAEIRAKQEKEEDEENIKLISTDKQTGSIIRENTIILDRGFKKSQFEEDLNSSSSVDMEEDDLDIPRNRNKIYIKRHERKELDKNESKQDQKKLEKNIGLNKKNIIFTGKILKRPPFEGNLKSDSNSEDIDEVDDDIQNNPNKNIMDLGRFEGKGQNIGRNGEIKKNFKKIPLEDKFNSDSSSEDIEKEEYNIQKNHYKNYSDRQTLEGKELYKNHSNQTKLEQEENFKLNRQKTPFEENLYLDSSSEDIEKEDYNIQMNTHKNNMEHQTLKGKALYKNLSKQQKMEQKKNCKKPSFEDNLYLDSSSEDIEEDFPLKGKEHYKNYSKHERKVQKENSGLHRKNMSFVGKKPPFEENLYPDSSSDDIEEEDCNIQNNQYKNYMDLQTPDEEEQEKREQVENIGSNRKTMCFVGKSYKKPPFEENLYPDSNSEDIEEDYDISNKPYKNNVECQGRQWKNDNNTNSKQKQIEQEETISLIDRSLKNTSCEQHLKPDLFLEDIIEDDEDIQKKLKDDHKEFDEYKSKQEEKKQELNYGLNEENMTFVERSFKETTSSLEQIDEEDEEPPQNLNSKNNVKIHGQEKKELDKYKTYQESIEQEENITIILTENKIESVIKNNTTLIDTDVNSMSPFKEDTKLVTKSEHKVEDNIQRKINKNYLESIRRELKELEEKEFKEELKAEEEEGNTALDQTNFKNPSFEEEFNSDSCSEYKKVFDDDVPIDLNKNYMEFLRSELKGHDENITFSTESTSTADTAIKQDLNPDSSTEVKEGDDESMSINLNNNYMKFMMCELKELDKNKSKQEHKDKEETIELNDENKSIVVEGTENAPFQEDSESDSSSDDSGDDDDGNVSKTDFKSSSSSSDSKSVPEKELDGEIKNELSHENVRNIMHFKKMFDIKYQSRLVNPPIYKVSGQIAFQKFDIAKLPHNENLNMNVTKLKCYAKTVKGDYSKLVAIASQKLQEKNKKVIHSYTQQDLVRCTRVLGELRDLHYSMSLRTINESKKSNDIYFKKSLVPFKVLKKSIFQEEIIKVQREEANPFNMPNFNCQRKLNLEMNTPKYSFSTLRNRFKNSFRLRHEVPSKDENKIFFDKRFPKYDSIIASVNNKNYLEVLNYQPTFNFFKFETISSYIKDSLRTGFDSMYTHDPMVRSKIYDLNIMDLRNLTMTYQQIFAKWEKFKYEAVMSLLYKVNTYYNDRHHLKAEFTNVFPF